MQQIAIIGAGGQLGFYVTKRLLGRGFKVIGVVRSGSQNLFPGYELYSQVGMDLSKPILFQKVFSEMDLGIIINLAGLSSTQDCERNPSYSEIVNFGLVTTLLDYVAKNQDENSHDIRFFQASSSEMFSGDYSVKIVNESTPLAPDSIYGKHKALAHEFVQKTRVQKNIDATNLILFNHESPRRETKYISRKITRTSWEIAHGYTNFLSVGNIAVSRDWSHAEDFSHVIENLIHTKSCGDLVVASGSLHSIQSFVQTSFEFFNLQPKDKYLRICKDLFRSSDHPGLMGDPSKLKSLLGHVKLRNFEELVIDMCQSEGLLELN